MFHLHKWTKSSGGPIGIDTLRTCTKCGIVQKYMMGLHLDSGWLDVTGKDYYDKRTKDISKGA